MAAPNPQQLAAAPTDASAHHPSAVTTGPLSPQGAPGFAMTPQQFEPVAASPSQQGAPGFAVAPQQGAHVAAAPSPQVPPGFWVAPLHGSPLATPALPQGASVMIQLQGAPVMAPHQQHFAPVMVPGSEHGTPMPVQAAATGMMAPMPLQTQAMAALQPSQGMPYVQHMTGSQQEMALFNAVMGPSYGLYLHNELPSFGAPESSLPRDASSTLYVEGLPSNCTRREVAHIFRQYMGFREVTLVNKGSSRHVMCFVDFATPAQAFLVMQTLQGYKFDQQDHHSPNLHLQFSHSPRVGAHGGC